MNHSIDVAIIGAGPYGLSLAAYLDNAGIEFRIFGKTMDSWKKKMPPGMLLKSYPWANSLYDPASSFTLKKFCADQELPYHDSHISVPLETFVAYGEAFQSQFVPNVENKMLVSIDRSTKGFQITFDDGEILNVRYIVIGVGLHHFKYLPPFLKDLPTEVLSHSGEYGSLENLTGRKVAVFGSGASATDLAALLYNKKTDVSLISRCAELAFMPAPEIQTPSFPTLRRVASPLKPLKQLISPNSCIGSSWLLKVCANAPDIIHLLPERIRLDLVRNELGPSGHWAVKDIVEEHIRLHLGRNLDYAELRNGKLNLCLSSPDGITEKIQIDHLIAATGYKIDLTKLDFLKKLLPAIHSVENTPILSSNYESSVPGLYFIGPASANSFGPVARFVCGAIHPARRITQHLLKKTKTKASLSTISESTTQGSIKKDSSLPENRNSSLGPNEKRIDKPNILLVSTMFRTPYRVLRCAHAAGGTLFVLGTQGAKGLKSSRYCKAFMSTDRPINGEFDMQLAEQINRHIETLGIDIVLGGDTPSTRSLIAIRELLKAPCFPMPSLDQFDLLNNKWEFYHLCKSLGIQTPQSRLFQNVEDLIKEIDLKSLTFPQVAKPLTMEAGIGVFRLDFENVRSQLEKISYHPILVQDFIEGEDIGASVFCLHGKILAFIAHKFHRAAYLSFFDQTIYNDLNKIVQNLKLDGIYNFDMRRTSDGRIFYLECNPRVFWKISMSMLSGMNFISFGLSKSNNDTLIRPLVPSEVKFPKAIMLQALLAPWSLGRSSFDTLKFQYSDPIPYLRETFGLENDIGSHY